ncbi:MAG: riboflavin synthase [Oceanospirillaceae bacterium]|nr:riboflavin synthase [Oceanospirillaceae bacterium]|tara:strand:- start:826 stop:1458 length:633 start_codon:yes stop_codon:yes gene_type:complete
MFTGIVQTRLPVCKIERKDDFATLIFEFPPEFLQGLQNGASVAINGTCLTVREIDADRVSFNAIDQTLKVTNLGALTDGDIVNIERAAKYGDEIGGHVLSGHVMDQVEVLDVIESADNLVVWFERPEHLAPFILDKGFVSLNGCSLTIAEVDGNRFSVHLIPETRDVTTFGLVKTGDRINLEVDAQTQAVVETVRRMLLSPEVLAALKGI